MHTTIIHEFQKELGISAVDYMVANRINMLSNKPEYPYCTEKTSVMARNFGLGERTIRRSVDVLIANGVVEKGEKQRQGLRTLPKWYEGEAMWRESAKVTNSSGKRVGQSDQVSGSKRPTQSAKVTNSPVPPNKEESKREGERTSPIGEGAAPMTVPTVPVNEYGKKDINDVLAYLLSVIRITGFAEPVSEQRIWAANIGRLGKEIGAEEFTRRLRALLDDPYKRKCMNKTKRIYYEIKGFIPERTPGVTIP